MNTRRWFFLFYLFIAPLMVAFSQVLFLDFPKVNFFTGASYSPFPQIFYVPLWISVVLLTIGVSLTLMLSYLDRRNVLGRYRRTIWVCQSLVLLIVFWFGINLSQRAVIFDYLAAINANGLHFLRMFSLPTVPEVFPKDGYLPFYTAIVTGSVGVIGIIIFYYTLYRRI